MKVHELKTLRPHFQAVRSGLKTAELRVDDRGFQVGDALLLREYNESLCECCMGDYTGLSLRVVVTHVLRDFRGLAAGWVMLSFKHEREDETIAHRPRGAK